MAEKQVIVVGYDESDHSQYALEWTLQHFFTNQASKPLYKLIVVHAKATPISVLSHAGPGLNYGSASSEMFSRVEGDLKKQTEYIIQKAKEICKANEVEDVEVIVSEGDPRNVICETVEKYKASFLIVGSHGYGVLKRAVLGSVSDHCSHYAKCSVTVVRDPKA
uniref:universal stress protein A-like protein n=1 Tax=Erigeron canadensis TaxID=72917 RepID=UPI001CB8FDD6|nr:universal stress protein A-like protein [Erigeron canadensis]